jgi:hypothetical protein
MRIWLIMMSLSIAGPALGKVSETIYAQELVNRTVAKHPDIAVITMHVTSPRGGDNVIIASNIGRIGKQADADDLKVIQTGIPHLALNKTGDRFEVELVLKDANSRNIGALGIVFPYKAGDDKAALQGRAEGIRDELARHISHRANLLEPARYDTTIPTQSYGQSLVDQALLRHPNVVILALHAKVSPSADNVIVASNIGRIGKKADADDLHVIATGEDKLELNETGDRYEVEQTLWDVSGNTIGAVGIVFAYAKGQDTAPLQFEAKAVRLELSRRISNVDNLLQPYPFDARYSVDTYAQQLVDNLLAAHTDVLIMAIHAAKPGSKEYVIAASNIGRIGKAADEDDMKVIKASVPNLEVNAAGNRFEAEVPLLDSAKRSIGALSVVFPYKAGDDRSALRLRAEKIRDEMAPRIPGAAALFAPEISHEAAAPAR